MVQGWLGQQHCQRFALIVDLHATQHNDDRFGRCMPRSVVRLVLLDYPSQRITWEDYALAILEMFGSSNSMPTRQPFRIMNRHGKPFNASFGLPNQVSYGVAPETPILR
jgi:hypothetical protein